MTIPRVQFPEVVSGAPQWVLLTAATAVTALVLLVVYARIIRRRARVHTMSQAATGRVAAARATVASAGPLAVLGTCGMVLSLYGLYGFATVNMQLSWPFAIPIMAIFDLAEVTCFVSLYRSAAVESTWTRPMRRTRRMAWLLVAASAAANGAHAPGNWMATLAFAIVPPVSAKLIEFELDKQMDSNATEREDDARPGFVRLLQLGYLHVWAGIFARLGFDAASKDGVIQQDARIRRAARQLHQLGRALDEFEELEKNAQTRKRRKRQQGAKKRIDSMQAKAEMAIDVSGIAGDTPAQLLLARHLTTRGRVVDLARIDVRDPMAIVTMLEELAIVPSAKAIEAGARAAQAEQRLQDAEEARDVAQAARDVAQAEAEQVRVQAADVLAAAQKAKAEAETAASEIQQRAEAAEKARREAETARSTAQSELDELTAQVAQLRSRARDLRASASSTDSERQAVADELAALRRQAQEAADLVSQRKRDAETAQRDAQQALTARQSAANDVEAAQATIRQLTEQAERLRGNAQEAAERQQRQAAELARLVAERQQAEEDAREAAERANRAREMARVAEEAQNAAAVALRHARTEIMDALTSPETYEPPRWTSQAKMRGWDLYLHKVRTERTEPTDAELAGEDRDPSTARKWLPEFRAELARLTAAALPAQQGAHDRTADEAPALV